MTSGSILMITRENSDGLVRVVSEKNLRRGSGSLNGRSQNSTVTQNASARLPAIVFPLSSSAPSGKFRDNGLELRQGLSLAQHIQWRDFRLSPRCKLDLYSSVMLSAVDW